LASLITIRSKLTPDSELRFRRDLHSLIVEKAIPDAMFVHDDQGRFVEVNQQACNSLGYSREELLNMTVLDVEQDFDLPEAVALWRQLGPGEIRAVQGHHRRRDGSTFPVEVRFCVTTHEGRPLYVGLARDLSEHNAAIEAIQEKDAEYRAAIEASIDGFLVVDTDGRLIETNDAYLHQSGYGRKELLKLGIRDLEARMAPGEIEAKINEILEEGHADFDTHHKRKDGSIWPVRVVTIFSPIKGGRFFAFITDLTEDRNREAEIVAAQNQLEATLRAIPDLLFEMTLDGKYCRVFTSSPDLLAAPAETLPGRSVHDVLPEPAANIVMSVLKEAATKGYSHGKQIQLPLASGERWFELSAARKSDEHNEAARLIVLSRDITERKRTEHTLVKTSSRLKEAQRIAKMGSWELDLIQNQLTWSDEIFRIFEIDQEHFGASYDAFLQAVHPDDRDAVDAAYNRSLQTREPYSIIHKLLMPDGRIKYVHERCETDFDSNGKPMRSVGTVQDVTERVVAEEKIRLYAELFEHSGEAIIVTDHENHIVDANSSFTRMTGFTLDEVRGKDPRILASGKTPPEVYQMMWASLNEMGYWQGELWDRRKDGAIFPKWTSISVIRDVNNAVSHYVASFLDISERKAAEARIEHLARHDPLTGLLNRFSLQERLEQALMLAHRENRQLAIMLIDLDRFKLINDTLGHHIGDALLVEVAKRLQACVRESDIVARLGGDEFVAVLTATDSAAEAAMITANKLLTTLSNPYRIEGQELHSSPSIGVSLYPVDGEGAAVLMKAADAAMYHAKEKGRNNVQFFTSEMSRTASERLYLERELRMALEQRHFELHYQPQVRADDGLTCGVEALVRWKHPQDGLIMPDKFIPIAEELGLIEELGGWVLDEACRQFAAWKAQGIMPKRISVNLSAHQLRSARLVDQIREAMTSHAIEPGELELEVTESVAMADPERAISRLRALRQLGVELAIDDFGTGYSSLAYLKLLPIQTLKLDRTFVSDIDKDENDAAISAAAVALAHNLGLRVVAEGVENEAQKAFLSSHHCEILQGYLFSKPLPANEVSTYIKRRPTTDIVLSS
jgi:diguanylate cyclase (GGDEF)-like protein/PAS domain S-box-containing protein